MRRPLFGQLVNCGLLKTERFGQIVKGCAVVFMIVSKPNTTKEGTVSDLSAYKPHVYRMTQQELELIRLLSDSLGVSHTDVVRLGCRAVRQNVANVGKCPSSSGKATKQKIFNFKKHESEVILQLAENLGVSQIDVVRLACRELAQKEGLA
jgi:hypothetical protein